MFLRRYYALMPAGEPRVFICYRREDSPYAAMMICKACRSRFGSENVFMDTDSIQGGTDWPKRIAQALDTCDVLIAVIGKSWLGGSNNDGQSRLEDIGDEVRREIRRVLNRGRFARVLPVLVDGAKMPAVGSLPHALIELADRQAISVGALSFDTDVHSLLRFIESPAEDFDTPLTSPVDPDEATRPDLADLLQLAKESPRYRHAQWEDLTIVHDALDLSETPIGVEFMRLRRSDWYAIV